MLANDYRNKTLISFTTAVTRKMTQSRAAVTVKYFATRAFNAAKNARAMLPPSSGINGRAFVVPKNRETVAEIQNAVLVSEWFSTPVRYKPDIMLKIEIGPPVPFAVST